MERHISALRGNKCQASVDGKEYAALRKINNDRALRSYPTSRSNDPL